MHHNTQHTAAQRILETACVLFERHGTLAVGVNRIIAQSEVAKATFYTHYSSKQRLVHQVLRTREAHISAWWKRTIAEHVQAKQQSCAYALFDVLEQWMEQPTFAGCLFTRVLMEHPKDTEIIQLTHRHKESLVATLADHLEDEDCTRPLARARALVMLLDGALLTATHAGHVSALRQARRAAALLV